MGLTKTLPNALSFEVINTEALRELIREELFPREMVSPKTAEKLFDCSRDFLEAMVKEGRIQKYWVPGNPRMIRYKVSEIEKLFKPVRI